MKLLCIVFLIVSSASAQYPALPTIQELRKTRNEELRKASRDTLQYLRKYDDPKAFDAFAEKWLGDRAPIGFACLEQQLLIHRALGKGFFFKNKLLSYAIRKNPVYGRAFLIKLLTNKTFSRHEVAACFLEIHRMSYSTYWFPKDRWYSLLADYLTDTDVCVEMVSCIPGKRTAVYDVDTKKVTYENEPDRWITRKVRRYETSYNLLPSHLKSPDLDIKKIDHSKAKQRLDATLQKVLRERETVRKRNAIWAKILDYRTSKLPPADLRKLLTAWKQSVKRPKRLYLDDLQCLIFLLMREIELAEKGSKEAGAGVSVIFPEIVQALTLPGITIDAVGKGQTRSVGDARLWLRAQLETITKKATDIPTQHDLNGFWQWIQDLDPATVDESTMLSQKVKLAE